MRAGKQTAAILFYSHPRPHPTCTISEGSGTQTASIHPQFQQQTEGGNCTGGGKKKKKESYIYHKLLRGGAD